MTEYVEHNLIKDDTIDKREYQDYLVDKATEKSTLVVLPTGTGKTIVTLRVTANRLLDNYGGTSVLLAPTKPLVEQHYETYTELLDISDDEIVMFTGDIRPDERKKVWNNSPSVVIATPQVIENDLISKRISFDEVNHLTIDECHRATGDYSYVYIAERYIQQANEPLITGLSASPGDTKEDILNICDNINVESIEIITENDDRIKPYIHNTKIEPRFIDISDEILEVRDLLQEVYKDRLVELYENDYVDSRSKTLSQKKLHQARGRINKDMQKGDSDAYQAISFWAEAMKLNKAVELIETQGVVSFLDYYERLENEMRDEDGSKAVERLISDPKIQKAVRKARDFDGVYEKFDVLRSELVNSVKINDGKALVFTKSRDTVVALREELGDQFDVGRLVGQTDKDNSQGMTQTEQKDAVKSFESGEYEVLVATQIAEEGLDINEVDLVVFYEPASKGIEQIQRQGRTGRTQEGRVIMLIGNDTRDVGMYYKSKSNVEQMQDDVSELQGIEDLEDEIKEELEDETEQVTLGESFDEESDENEEIIKDVKDSEDIDVENPEIETDEDEIVIIADSRETNSSVVRGLDVDDEVNVDVNNNLEVGDYILSNECAVERKTIDDFHSTITGGKRSIFEQMKNLSNNYDNPILLIEGGHGELYTRNIHPNAVRGILASIVSDFGGTIVESVDEDDTAEILKSIAKKEQVNEETVINPHGNKDTKTVEDQQKYIMSSIDGIGPKTAEKLLNHFGDIQSVFNADIEDLQSVEGIGEDSASKIYTIVRTDY